jgi:hypothetical protein
VWANVKGYYRQYSVQIVNYLKLPPEKPEESEVGI